MCNLELIISSLITTFGIIAGVWQFNKAQKNLQEKELRQRKFEAVKKFKEIQFLKYKEAAETVSSLVYAEDYQSNNFTKILKRFWQLYWVELSSVEDSQVEGVMKKLGDFILVLENRKFENISESDKSKLRNLGYDVAQAIKQSSQNWDSYLED